jgi:NAD+ kinase
MTQLRRIGVIANLEKSTAVEVAGDAVTYLESRIPTLVLQEELAERLGKLHLAAESVPLTDDDVVVVFGGDGTILAASARCAPTRTPMLGVNLGRFGFLTEALPEQLESVLGLLLEGEYDIEERLTLSCEIVRGKNVVRFEHALNEVVVAHGPLARVLHLSTSINGKYLTTYASDGIIVATPTGSTAYSLSAGGPLVHPEVSLMLLTPICPHTLTTRALLVPDSHEIAIQVERTDGDTVQVTVDGQRGLPLEPGDKILVKKGAEPTRLVTRVGGASFYEKLQTKLRWGERIIF